MKKINACGIDLSEVTMLLLMFVVSVVTIKLLWVQIEYTTVDISHKKQIIEYEIRERQLKIESDSITNESTKEWIKSNSQYWDGRGDE